MNAPLDAEAIAADAVARAQRPYAAGQRAAAGQCPSVPASSEEGQWLDPPAAEAYHGLAGAVVRQIEPHTEADPVAILMQFLASFGNAVGRGPYYQVEGDRHATNIYAVLVGRTSKARRGTSASRVRQIFEVADEQWSRQCIHSGMSSGEGLIWAVRDPIAKRVREGKGAEARYVEQETDPGVADKRLMIVESEFAGVLRVMQRPGNIISRIVRDGWDRDSLATLTKNSPARATGVLLSIVGHITEYELQQSLDRTEMGNGFANRFLYACVRRSHPLPHGGNLGEDTIRSLANRTTAALEHARKIDRVEMTPEARADWERVYPALSEGQPGLLGAVIARAEAQVIRLALLYALLDLKAAIESEHLHAARAVWEYCEASARHIFGDLLGDPVADDILRVLRQTGEGGKTRTEIRDLFGRHQSGTLIDRALANLAQQGKARMAQIATGGRPAELWSATAARGQ